MIQALRYLNQGLSVIPVTPWQKAPPLIDFKEYTTRLPTVEEVTKWWTEWPNANIGCVTGKVSGVTVVEADKAKGGFLTLKTLPMKSQLLASSGGGGLHMFFQYSDRVKTWVGKLGQGVDVRNDGGYIVMSPSLHPSGRRYAWLTPGGFDRCLLAKLVLTEQERVNNVQPASQSVIQEALASIGPGSRHYQFSRVIGKLNSIGLKPADIFLLLKPYADAHQFDSKELQVQVDRMCKLYASEAPSRDNEQTYDLTQFLAEEENVEWISDGFLAKRTVGFVAGLGGSFKTWMLMDLAIECARGGMWLNRFPVAKCKVLYIDQERFKGETKRRFSTLINGKDLNPKELDGSLYLKCGTTIRIDLPQSYDAFKAELDRIKPDLVIVDSFSTFQTKEGSSNMEMQQVMEKIKALRSAFGCTFLFIDHENKGVYQKEREGMLPTKEDMLGAVAKSNAAEFVLTIRKDSEDSSIVHHTKSTLGPTVDSFSMRVLNLNEEKTKIKVEAIWTVHHKEAAKP